MSNPTQNDTLTNPDTRTKLQAQFANTPSSQHGSRWEELWVSSFTPWDKGVPNPALVDLLEEGKVGKAMKKDGRRKRALVAGCGRGYDILLLSSHGYSAYGLDISRTALSHARTNASDPSVLSNPIYSTRDVTSGKGCAKFLYGDFFGDEWKKEVEVEDGEEWDGKFDLTYDFTFLCALPPSVRHNWALRNTELLSPTGHLICIEFPSTKPENSGGPPWALPPKVYLAHLGRPGLNLGYAYDREGTETDERWALNEDRLATMKEIDEGKCLKRVDHFRPKRTHDMGCNDKGEVEDWVGIWRHREAVEGA